MESKVTLEDNLKNNIAAPVNNNAQLSIYFIKVYPSDFIHGLLSYHVAEETGCVAGECPLKENSKVTFSCDNKLYNKMMNDKKININDLLADWFIEKIIDDQETGYCGIIYKNIVNQNLILAHRSTNFKLGLGSNLFKQSGVQTDYQSVMLGILVPHMAYGHHATKIAVEISKKLKFTLSITGHSLGSFLAEMSIFYCYYEFNFKYVKAIVFDGPGCWDLMNKINENLVKNSVNRIKLEELDITSYITAPNLVNCCNSHVGKTFTIFPKLEKDLGIYSNIIKKFGENYNSGICSTIYGHDLIYILPLFDESTGKPIECELVLRWPKITHKNFSMKKIPHSKFTYLFNNVKEITITILNGFYNSLIQEEQVMTTMQSIAFVLQDLLLGKIDLDQFWNVHKLLNIKNNFMKPLHLNPKEEFNLIYNLNYQISPHDEYELKLNDTCDDIDRFLRLTKEKEVHLKSFIYSINKVVPFWNYYNYYSGLNQIKIIEKFRKEVTVNDLRDYMRYLLVKDAVLLNKLSSVNKENSFFAEKENRLVKLNFLKNNYQTFKNIIEKEKTKYPDEKEYVYLLNSVEGKIEKFLLKSIDDLIYKNQILMLGRTNAGKSTLGNRILFNDDKTKIFRTSTLAETFVPCKISTYDELQKASIHLEFQDETSENYEAESINNLIEILSKFISKESILENKKMLDNTEIDSPRVFFPKLKSGTSLIDTPGFSENESMKKFNLSQLAKEKHTSIIIFLIPLEIGGSLMQENLDILNNYKSKDSDKSNNIVFVLTKLKNYKISCENENPDYSEEEVLDYMNKSIQKGFIIPLKKKFPYARIIIYEIGREMESYYYNKDSLLLKITSKNEKENSDIDIKSQSLHFLNDYINDQFINNETEYLNYLKNKLFSRIEKIKNFMLNFHCEEKNVKENKMLILEKLTDIVNQSKLNRMEVFKTEIFNEQILQEIIDKNIKEESLNHKEKCSNLIEAEILSRVENYLIDLGYLLEDRFYEHIYFYVMRELPSDKESVRLKVLRMREEIVKFLSTENQQNKSFDFFKKIKYVFTRYLPNFFRSELSKYKLQIYDMYSKDYWLDGYEITEFFERILKKLPEFVELIGLKYRDKIYCGKSNDLYQQLDHLIKSINKKF
jgi:hypothetical protein